MSHQERIERESPLWRYCDLLEQESREWRRIARMSVILNIMTVALVIFLIFWDRHP